MGAIKAWVKDLNIDEGKYREWLSAAGNPSQITAWSVLAGHIAPSTYLNWARDHYGLCSLDDSFFNQTTTPPIWEKVKALPYWSAQLAPIHEWDGTLYVACVEPQNSINWGFSVQYVLASPAQLQNFWMRLNSTAPTSSTHKKATPTDMASTVTTSTNVAKPAAVQNSHPAPHQNIDNMNANTFGEHAHTDQFEIVHADDSFEIESSINNAEDDFSKQLAALNSFENNPEPQFEDNFSKAEETVYSEENVYSHEDLNQLDGQSFEELPPTPDIQLQTATNIEALKPDADIVTEDNGIEGLNLNLDIPSRVNNDDPTNIFNQEFSSDVDSDSPEGLSLETKTNIFNDNAPQGLSLSSEPEAPAGLSFKSEPIIEPSATAESEAQENTHIPEVLLNTKTSIDINTMENQTPVNSAAAMAPPQTPNDVYTGKAAPVTAVNPSAQQASTPTSTPPEQLESTIIIENAPIDLGQVKSERDIVAFFFKQLRQEYTKTMALIFKGNNLYPWHWDNSWTNVSSETKKAPVNLNGASVFRIVHRTKMPYHGYVIESDINKQFFKDWGMAELPGCLTLIPLTQSGYLFGVLLCVGDANKNSNFVLSFAEKIADQFLEKISSNNKAA